MNALDRLIAWFSPAHALRRQRMRLALRAYDAATRDRRNIAWSAGNTSANAEIRAGLVPLRQRSRELIRNNPYAARAVSVWVSNLVGTGIMAKLSDGQDLWDRWVRECDAEGRHDFYGLQALTARTVFESGEALVRLHYLSPGERPGIPLRLRVLEPDYLDGLKTEELPDGGYIDGGIEFDGTGRRTAYWLYDQHPGAMVPVPKTYRSRRVPAEDIIHVYECLRPGQSRGVPKLAPVMLKLRDLADYEEAELMRKGIEACFAGFVTSDDRGTYAASGPVQPGDRDVRSGTASRRPEQPLEQIASGMIKYLSPGETITFGAPAGVQGYNEFMTQQQHVIAAGIDITFEMLTGDLSRVNYSSMRGGRLEFRRRAEQYQWQVLIPQLCDAVAAAWRRAALLSGFSRAAAATFEWTPPKWDWVDPLKDAIGVILELAAGLTSWEEEARRRGWTPEKLLAEIQANQKAFKDAGITIQWDQLLLGAIAAAQSSPTPAKESADA